MIANDIEIPGVDDVEGPQDPDQQQIEIDDLNIHEPDPAPIQADTVQEAPIQQDAPVQQPVQSPDLR